MRLKIQNMKYILICSILFFTVNLIGGEINQNIIKYKGLDFFLFNVDFLNNNNAGSSNITPVKISKPPKKKKEIKTKPKRKIIKKKVLSEELRLIKAGEDLYKNKSYKSAENTLIEFLQKYPDSQKKDRAVFLLGNIMLEQKRYDEAIMYFKKITEEAKNSSYKSKSYYKTAYIYFLKNDYDSAENLLVKMQYENVSKEYLYKGYILLGDVYLKKKKPAEAVKYYKKALTVGRKYGGEALYKLGKIYEEVSEIRNFELSEKYYTETADKFPDSEWGKKAKKRAVYIRKNFLDFGE